MVFRVFHSFTFAGSSICLTKIDRHGVSQEPFTIFLFVAIFLLCSCFLLLFTVLTIRYSLSHTVITFLVLCLAILFVTYSYTPHVCCCTIYLSLQLFSPILYSTADALQFVTYYHYVSCSLSADSVRHILLYFPCSCLLLFFITVLAILFTVAHYHLVSKPVGSDFPRTLHSFLPVGDRLCVIILSH